MRIPPKSILAAAALLGCLQSAPALAQAPLEEVSAGYANLHLRPTTGASQNLDGAFVGGAWRLAPPWSLEGLLGIRSGTEDAAVELRQLSLAAGPRYTWTLPGPWRPFAHVLVGWDHLLARDATDSDQKASLSVAPGLGVEYVLDRTFAVRVQEDWFLTHYAGLTQHSACFSLGLVYRP